MRYVLQKIDVHTSANGTPCEFMWRGHSYSVQRIIERWKESGCWWDREPEREVYRVLDSAGKTFELHCLYETLFTTNSEKEDNSMRLLLDSQLNRTGPGHWVLYGVED
ncbi:MAG: hypothetical protein IT209_07690 [Armatimonadetes bacterium]|nr:hypothetical protein [Armatimonadota bacterium]